MQILNILLLILILQVFTNTYSYCTRLATHKLHCLIKIYTNVLYVSYIYLPDDDPESAETFRTL
jgi:hypothetical protein